MVSKHIYALYYSIYPDTHDYPTPYIMTVLLSSFNALGYNYTLA